jgi:hypothetical protein
MKVGEFFPELRISFNDAVGCHSSLMMEAVRTSETSVDNHFTRQYIPEDNSEHYVTTLEMRFS